MGRETHHKVKHHHGNTSIPGGGHEPPPRWWKWWWKEFKRAPDPNNREDADIIKYMSEHDWWE